MREIEESGQDDHPAVKSLSSMRTGLQLSHFSSHITICLGMEKVCEKYSLVGQGEEEENKDDSDIGEEDGWGL